MSNNQVKAKNYPEWSKEELIREIEALKKQKTYGLVWERDKVKENFDYFVNWEGVKTKEEFSPESKDKFPVLTEINNKEIITDKKQPTNLLIEGDNYHSLAVLNFTHKEAVDVIYIDPPYNTGNNDFKYNDKFVELEDSYKHSKWLSFMSKRLSLAKNLLKNTGVIFISIDDNEVAQLKLLCNEIFGEQNFISQIIIQTNKGGRDYLQIATTHEYLLCYGKSQEITLNELPKDITLFEFSDKKGLYELRELRNRNPKFNRENRPNLFYPIYVNDKIKDKYGCSPISLEKNNEYKIEILPRNSLGKDSCWRWGKPLLLKNILEDQPNESEVVARKKNTGGWNIYEKSRKFTTKAKSIWDETEMRTELGTIVLRGIFGKTVFDHPKPVPLIKKIVKLGTQKDSIILDFMAGSGTTAQAVLEVNKEDGGNRQFILCTNNENNICSEICYPRINKVIEGYTNSKKEKFEALGGNLKYFKTDFVESEPTDKNKRKLVDKCTEMLCIKENSFNKVKDEKKWKIFKNNETYLGMIFDEESIKEFVEETKKIEGKMNVYVFSRDESVPTNEFKAIKNKVTLCAIPEVILKVYRKVFKND
ncbi:DNA methylase [uncultured archaeon]|nr:DNA methylase [uncultured archaeon]